MFSLVCAVIGAIRPIVIADLLAGQPTSKAIQNILEVVDVSLAPIVILLILEIIDLVAVAFQGVTTARLASFFGEKYRKNLTLAAVRAISLPDIDFINRYIGLIKSYVDSIEIYLRHSLIPTFGSIAQLIIAIFLASTINGNIAFILGIEIAVLFLITLTYAPIHTKLTVDLMRADEVMLSSSALNPRKGVSIWFGGISSIWSKQRIINIQELANKKQLIWTAESLYYSVSTATTGIFIVFGYWFLISLGRGTIHDFTALIIYCGLMMSPVMRLAAALPEYREFTNARNEIRRAVDSVPEIESKAPNSISLSFRAQILDPLIERKKELIDIANGSRVALIGPSGSGKTSTLLALLGAKSGMLDNVSIGEYSIEIIRPYLAEYGVRYLSDTPVFEAGSITENCGDVESVCIDKLVKLELFPDKSRVQLAKLLNQKIQASGEPLSLGERQRIQLLRTLLHQPKVLIMDEALSGLEEDLEMKIMMSLISDTSIEIIIYSGHRKVISNLFNKKILLTKNT